MKKDPPASMLYENMCSRLVAHLPELSDAYETELQWWSSGVPGPHVMYGDVLNPHIQRMLEAADDDALRRVFAFVEMLARNDDVRVQEVVSVTICERLGSDKGRLAKAQRFMGPATRRLSDEVEGFWIERSSVT